MTNEQLAQRALDRIATRHALAEIAELPLLRGAEPYAYVLAVATHLAVRCALVGASGARPCDLSRAGGPEASASPAGAKRPARREFLGLGNLIAYQQDCHTRRAGVHDSTRVTRWQGVTGWRPDDPVLSVKQAGAGNN